MATPAVLMVDHSQSSGRGGTSAAGGGEEGADQLRAGRQRYLPVLGAVVLEVRPISGVEIQRFGRELAWTVPGR